MRLRHFTLFTSFFLVHNAAGFFPTKFREGLVGNHGVSHEQMTQEVFLELALRYFPAETAQFKAIYGEPLTQSMLDARDAIVKANEHVDKDQEHAALHFDGESFAAGQSRLQDLKGKLLQNLRDSKASQARDLLGQCLHTVQDFYSHSNWVELKRPGLAPLGRNEALGGAGPLQATCKPCSGFDTAAYVASSFFFICMDCSGSGVAADHDLLTSGYYFGEDAKPVIAEKCHHGGPFDNFVSNFNGIIGEIAGGITLAVTGVYHPGINKDSLACDWSPHYKWHGDAVKAAKDASAQFIDDIKQATTESQFRLLFGLGTALAFVMDTTGSMTDIQAGVAAAAEAIAKQRSATADAVSLYAISEFNDPTTGPVYTVTTLDSFDKLMDGLPASGGGDCPELAMEGLLNAFDVVDKGAEIFLFTDASAKDYDAYVDEVVNAAVEKEVILNIFKFDSRCDDGLTKRTDSVSNKQYSQLVAETGGNYYSLARTDVSKVEGILDYTTMSQISPVLLVTDSVKVGGSTYDFPVDGKMNLVAVSVRCAGCQVNYTSPSSLPDSSNVTTLVLPGETLITVKNPPPGTWGLKISAPAGTDFILKVKGNSPIHLTDFSFVESTGRSGHGGYFKIDGPPPHNSEIGIIGEVYGTVSVSSWDLRSPKFSELIMTLPLKAGSGLEGFPDPNTFFGVATLPAQQFHIYLSGKDSAGFPFQRVITTPVTPIESNVTHHVGSLQPIPGLMNATVSTISGTLSSTSAVSSATSSAFLNSTSTTTKYWTNTTTTVPYATWSAKPHSTSKGGLPGPGYPYPAHSSSFYLTEIVHTTTSLCPIETVITVPVSCPYNNGENCSSGQQYVTEVKTTIYSTTTMEVTSTHAVPVPCGGDDGQCDHHGTVMTAAYTAGHAVNSDVPEKLQPTSAATPGAAGGARGSSGAHDVVTAGGARTVPPLTVGGLLGYILVSAVSLGGIFIMI